MREFFRFPHPVNESAARVVGGMSALLTVAILVTKQPWLLALLTYEFLARVIAGPRISIFARLANHLVVPALRLPNRPTPGPPKRFAQCIGLLFAAGACIAWFAIARWDVARGLLVVLAFFALLESVFGFCAGCFLFNQLMRMGLIPRETCEQCLNWRPRVGDGG
ncbi:MAG: DUF4395 domain-containing protein [Candidatus Eisenbacteria bacterium]